MILVKPSFEILTDLNNHRILESIEIAGRVCYKSEGRITADSAKSFVRAIVKSGHHSVIEHESVSVRFIVDRGVSHELVRHRLAAYSQESTRYCNYKGGVSFVIPPWVILQKTQPGYSEKNTEKNELVNKKWLSSILFAEHSYLYLIGSGWTPQQARSVLPNSLKTEIVMTANLREWLHVFKLRCSAAAHPQMVEIMLPLRQEFRKKIPVVFDDIPKKVTG